MSDSLVSIIVPVYKVEQYLRRCLDSIVNQTYTNLEIILIDDGSPDKCPKICDEYAAKDKRIVVIHKKNGGLSEARNVGLDICKGEFILFIDSDDMICLNAIQMMIRFSQNDVFIFSDIAKFDGDDSHYRNKCEADNTYAIYSSDELLISLCKDGPVYLRSICGKIFHKSFFYKLRFEAGKLYEDMYINYLLYYRTSQAIFIKAPLYYYRNREGSITNTTTLSTFALEAEEIRYHFFKRHGKTTITKYCLPHLCWDYLFLYGQGQTNAKEKFLYYIREYLSNSPDFNLHFIFLRLFAACPILYRIYRNLSPWHLCEQ